MTVLVFDIKEAESVKALCLKKGIPFDSAVRLNKAYLNKKDTITKAKIVYSLTDISEYKEAFPNAKLIVLEEKKAEEPPKTTRSTKK